ncbi:MAG: hypothetical protein R3B40_16890 [Polyangiales bacterium]|nr:hypothetical protein [Myxococcales bacterium]MCB9659708.1 hypothetical protein [Sandaracinaceae bacterium]
MVQLRRLVRDRLFLSALWVGAALLTSGCLDASVTFPITRELEFSASNLPLIDDFQENTADGLIVPSVACSNASTCPMASGIIVECNTEGLCDPAATTATIAQQDIDLREVMERFSIVNAIALRGVEYAVVGNTLNVDLPAVEVYWAPIGTASVDSAMHLGSFPAVRAGETPMARVPLDATGTAALNDHLEAISHQFRIFLEATIDVEPGDRFPQGAVMANVQFEVRASGQLN